MNIKEYYEKHNQRTLKDEEWESLAATLITAKFDEEKAEKWSADLEKMGVSRKSYHTLQPRGIQIRKFMAAASVLLVIAAAGWFFFLRNPLSPAQQLASNYLQTEFKMDHGSVRGPEAMEKNRGMAMEAYNSKQYEKALSYYQTIESEGRPKASDYFQMGLCLMYQKAPNYQRAVNAFKATQQKDASVYPDECNWFIGLCQLMLGNEAAARESLQKVVDSSSSRDRDRAAASRLLSKIK